MAENKESKRFPRIDFYKDVHQFFNRMAKEHPGTRYDLNEVLEGMNYSIDEGSATDSTVTVCSPDKKFTMTKAATRNRFNEVSDDIEERLKQHNIKWKFKAGGKRLTTYCYEEVVPYDFPKECETEKILNGLDLLRSVVGYTRTDLSKKSVKGNDEIISFSTSDLFGHAELVKTLFFAIRDKKVVEFTYYAANSNHPKHHILSPHYLKEYNQRWYLFGYSNEVSDAADPKLNADKNPREGYYTFSLDRIDDLKLRDNLQFHEKSIDYSSYFDDIVGVTHYNDQPNTAVDVTITTYSQYIHNLILSRPIHKSQTEVAPYKKKSPGKIRLHVCINKELERQLLGYGENIKVEWEGASYDKFKDRIKDMAALYSE